MTKNKNIQNKSIGPVKAKDTFKINNKIKAEQVRLIDGNNSEIMPFFKALQIAQNKELDLVEISSTGDLPVCKIMDFSKYKYELKKKQQDTKKKQKVISLKEIKVRPNIGQNDLMIKIKHAKEFIEQDDKVKVIVMFKGREITHPEIGQGIMNAIIIELGEAVKIEFGPKMQGNQLIALFVHNKTPMPK